MNHDRKIFVIGGILTAMVTGSSWLAYKADSDIQYRPDGHSPDYYLETFTALTHGKDGRPDKRLTADLMLHFPDDDTTELKQPRMTLYAGESPPWMVRAEEGWVSGDGEQILLRGRVYIDREGAEGVDPAHIVTRDLSIRPQEDYAETGEDTFLQSGSSWIESTGMQVWFTQPARVKLLADVRGRYEIR